MVMEIMHQVHVVVRHREREKEEEESGKREESGTKLVFYCMCESVWSREWGMNGGKE